MTKNNTTEWEEDFDRMFVAMDGRFLTGTLTVGKAKDFINTLLTQACIQERKDTLERCLEIGEGEIVEGFFAFESAINEEIKSYEINS